MDHHLRRATDAAALSALFVRSHPVLLARDATRCAGPGVAADVRCAARVAVGRAVSTDRYAGGSGRRGWQEHGTRDAQDVVSGLGHVRHVVCDPGVTRRGFAALVLAAVLAQARAAGLSQMDCWSTRTAVPFYSAQGFAVIGPRDMVFPGGLVFPWVEMSRTL